MQNTTRSLNPITRQELYKLGAAYLSLLEVPYKSDFRWNNQDIYCRLRDRLADISGKSPEEIQNEFEGMSYVR